MRHYPASNLTTGHPNSLQQVKPKGAPNWTYLINDELAYVMDNGTLRIYMFVAASVLAENIPDVVIPDGNATGTGRWEKQGFDGAGGGDSGDWQNIQGPTDIYTEHFMEDPFSMPEGDGVTSGIAANPTWEGEIWKDQLIPAQAGYGKLLRFSDVNETWGLARADNVTDASAKLGLSLIATSGTAGNGDILIRGIINHSNISSLTGNLGVPVFMSATTGGVMRTDIPIEWWSRQVGYKIANRGVAFEPDMVVIELVAGGEGE